MLEPKNAAERAIIDDYTEIFTLSEVIKRMYEADSVRVSLIPIRNEKKTLVRVYYSKGDETELVAYKEIEDVEGYCSEPWEVSFDHANSIYAHNFVEQDTTANNCTGNLDRPDTIATNCTGDIVINDKYGVFDKD